MPEDYTWIENHLVSYSRSYILEWVNMIYGSGTKKALFAFMYGWGGKIPLKTPKERLEIANGPQ